MRGPGCAVALAIAGTAAGAANALAQERITLVRLESRVEIPAPSAKIWARLVRGADLAACWPVWSVPENAERTLAAAGDRLQFTDEWGNQGISVVTFVAPGEQLRIANDPTDGSYLCRTSFVLEPAGSGRTVLRWIESYSDESSAADQAATAAKVQAGMEKTLAAFAARVAGP
ncbi:MAG: hypothetical protein ACRDGR_09955 [bacterium]